MPVTRRSPSYRYPWEIPALIFSMVLMLYGTMWLFVLIGDIIIDTETDWLLTLELPARHAGRYLPPAGTKARPGRR